jgi:GMP synthase-like glutamine amidotransferase
MIASALGARVFANPVKEIGWLPVHSVDASTGDLFRFPDTETVFHWHGETFDLPPGAVRLARSDACENQAFQMGTSVIGLQFHLETSQASATQLVAHCGDELMPSTYVQTADQILSVNADRYAAINQLMSDVLAYLTRGNDE